MVLAQNAISTNHAKRKNKDSLLFLLMFLFLARAAKATSENASPAISH